MNTTGILNIKTSNQRMTFLNAFDPVKRLLALSAIGLLALSVTFRAHALPIRNGGFETGDLEGWTTLAGFDGGVTSAEAAGGSYSLELDPGDIVYQDLETVRRFDYLSIYAKVDDEFWATTEDSSPSISACAMVQYSDGTLKMFDFGSSFYSDGWNKFSFALDSTKRVARVWFVIANSTPTPIYIDHVALRD